MDGSKLNRIAEVLKFQERSINWLGRKTGITSRTLQKYCKNTQQPTLSGLKKISEALNVDICDLIVCGNARDADLEE